MKWEPNEKNWNPVPNFYQFSQNRKTNNPILGILGTLEHQNIKRAKKNLISKIYQSSEHQNTKRAKKKMIPRIYQSSEDLEHLEH